MIEALQLSRRFGSVAAVRDVSFTARDGAVTGLLGPNGAGKTTTLRMLYTLVTPDEGEVRIDGRNAHEDLAATRRALGVLPDARGLYPRLTAREHIAYFGRLHGLEGQALERRIDALVEVLEMKDIARRRAEGFSQGERMKVSLARALVHEPNNLLLDEPTNGLDIMSARAVRGVIKNLKEQGRCIIFSSHVMQEVDALCDRVVVLFGGRVVADDTLAELRQRTGQENLEEAFIHSLRGRTG